MRRVLTAILASLLLLATGGSAVGMTGDCANNNSNWFSSVCYYKDTQFSGAYVEWASVALNITQTAATNYEFIAEHLILRDRYLTPATSTFLEVGDTAGGNSIILHTHEWNRMWYWVDGTGVYSENFIQYAPGGGAGDGLNRGWGIQWESANNAWVIYVGGAPQVYIGSWKSPSNTAGLKMFTGLEISNGGRALDASKNSGLFQNQLQQWRDLASGWHLWDLRWEQNDQPCGTAPTCLQGWWSTLWNNAKP